jgi:thiamine-monophosphate kinase
MSLITEFDLIDKYFANQPLARKDVILGIGDDAALLKPPKDQALVVSSDTLVAGVHFSEATPARAIGYKSLAVSLSDLAAMGAEPAWVMLNLTLPQADENWLREFSLGFFQLIEQYQLQLIGGDTTQGPLAINTQVMGFVPSDQALRRSTAQPGDFIYVTGHLGGAGYALEALQHHQPVSEATRRPLDYPIPRVEAGLKLRKLASAAIDISDGLAADLSHILEASQVGASIIIENLPIAKALNALAKEAAYGLALSAGDDYELCFTIHPSQKDLLQQLFMSNDCDVTYIGKIESNPGLRINYADGKPFVLDKKGWVHFR